VLPRTEGENGSLRALEIMMLVRYHGQMVGMVGAARYSLTEEFIAGRLDDADVRRVREVCEWALSVRRVTGYEPGRLPGDHPTL
jgi:hypothetical protein